MAAAVVPVKINLLNREDMENTKYLIPGDRTRQTKRWAYSPFSLFGSVARDFLFYGDEK